MIKIICKNCKYWKDLDHTAQPERDEKIKQLGECRSEPPFMINEQGEIIGKWPQITSDKWCGGFEVKEMKYYSDNMRVPDNEIYERVFMIVGYMESKMLFNTLGIPELAIIRENYQKIPYDQRNKIIKEIVWTYSKGSDLPDFIRQ